MDSFTFNKVAGAILGTLVFAMGVGFIAEEVYKPRTGQGAGFALPEPEVGGSGGEVEVVEEIPLGVLLASASADNGARVARKCQSCHTFNEGGENKNGPGLFDIVNRTIGAHNGFAYSDVLAGMGSNGDVWSYEDLDEFIAAPKAYAPGTKMTYTGLRSETDRADLLAYLGSLSNSPVAFPEVAVAEVEDDMEMGDEEMAHEGDDMEDMAHGEEAEAAMDDMKEEMEESVEEAVDAMEDMAEGVEEDAYSTMEETSDAVEAGADAVEETMGETVDAADTMVEETVDAAETMVEDAGDAAAEVVEDVATDAAETMETVTETVQENASEVMENVSEGVENVVEAITDSTN